jgi:hypothetical protein
MVLITLRVLTILQTDYQETNNLKPKIIMKQAIKFLQGLGMFCINFLPVLFGIISGIIAITSDASFEHWIGILTIVTSVIYVIYKIVEYRSKNIVNYE